MHDRYIIPVRGGTAYGLLRLDSGMKERQIEPGSVKEVFTQLIRLGLNKQEVERCVILANGKSGRKRQKRNDGDMVQMLSPVAGG